MANPEHLAKLKEGVESWGQWRKQNSEVLPDLHGANLVEADLGGAILSEADLSNANLSAAHLSNANLRGAGFVFANLSEANLSWADLSRTNLSAADLSRAILVATNLEGANLTASRVYGISAWDVRLERAIQSKLVITPGDETPIQVDNLEVAQFIYLLLSRQKLRDVITTIGEKAVLILGRFTERKELLDRMVSIEWLTNSDRSAIFP
jgi:hypothetical protein